MGSKLNANDTVGKTFGRLKILSIASDKPRIIKGKQSGYIYIVTCNCICGTTKNINYTDMTSGHTKSCGCLASENTIKRNYKHGDTVRGKHTKEWRTWSAVIARCYEKSNSRLLQIWC